MVPANFVVPPFTFHRGWRIFRRMKFLAALWLASWLLAGRCAAAPAPASVLESNVLCVRAVQLSATWLDQVRAFQSTNRTTGTVLDLRFADGDHATLAAAKVFFSSRKSPLMILVNNQTRGVAAELAAELRENKIGFIISSTNPPAGITADLTVSVSDALEIIYVADPFATTSTNSTATSAKGEMRAFVDHMTEAELVRRRLKDGEDESEDVSSPRPAPPQPVINDPALARALDLLKAISILHPVRK